MVTRRISGPVPSVSERRPEVSAGVDAALRRALAPDREARFATYEQLARSGSFRLMDASRPIDSVHEGIMQHVREALETVMVHPRTFFSTPAETVRAAVAGIEAELAEQVAHFRRRGMARAGGKDTGGFL